MAASRGRRALLTLGLAAAGLGGGGVTDWAEDEVGVQFHTFQDSRDATVLSPTVDLSKDFTDRTTLKVKFGVDAISAASDSCVRCHRQGAHDTRVVGSASVTRKLDANTKFSIGAELSHENFYQSATLLTSISRTLNKGNTTIAGGYSFSLNRPQLHPAAQAANQYANNAFVSVTQTLTKSTMGQVGYEVSQVNGYQGSPFLRALLNGDRVLGISPDARTRQTFTARVRQALPFDSYLETDYRYYRDTWSLHSNSLSAGLSHYVTRQLLATASYRWYQQTGAYFYAPEYFGSPQFFTGDFRLQPFSSALYTGRVTFTPRGGLLWLRDGAAFTAQYEFYKSTSGFEAAIFTGGVRVPLGIR